MLQAWESKKVTINTVEGKIGHLDGKLVHDDPDPFATWVARHNRYSDWEAYLQEHPDLAGQIQRLRSSRARRYRDAPFKPLAFFVYSYIIRRGFLDGAAGFNYAIAHAFYFWMISVKRGEARRERHRVAIVDLAQKAGTAQSASLEPK